MRKSFVLCCLWPVFLYGQTDYTLYVNPFIGTGGHGHTFPGATVPFGMVQLSPDTRIDGSWDGCSGYHYSDEYIYGFSHTHLSGTGCSDYGDIALLPFETPGKKKKKSVESKLDFLKYSLKFDHKNEKAEAGYYQVKLENEINAELTASTRAGFHRYTFPGKGEPSLVVKLTHRDKTLESDLKMVDATHLQGFRRSEAWARDQHIYFVIEFSSPATEQISQGKDGMVEYKTYTFSQLKGKPLLVKVGISTVSMLGARENLAAEIPHWDFEKTKTAAKAAWNKELSKIEVTSSDKDQLMVFYTALYHCMIHPSTASDVDGKYRGRDNLVHQAKGFTYYTVFSLWDTFRALHPLMAIIDQKRTGDFINTFLAQYQQADVHVLPVWELSSNETWCMIAYHSVSVMADAYAKGVHNFDVDLALEAMQKSSDFKYFGIELFGKKGYLEKEDEHESVSKTLEYAYDDWCIASFSEAAGKQELANHYYQRALSWRNMFDSNTGFIRPRSNGGWMEPFDPREVNNNYTEANAWQYTFFVPQDISGMMKGQGGPEKFAGKLDQLFTANSQTTGRDQSDITGLIGQYAHGNEPSHHMAYLYNYAGQPWKTQERIHQIEKDFYKNDPDGLIGNEDCGQMSAWYVLSALGFYPVCPGKAEYALGTPVFEKAAIHLENGKTFTIKAEGLSKDNFYLKDPAQLYLTHKEIMEGKELVLHMTGIPQKTNYPVGSLPNTTIEKNYRPAPVFLETSNTFHDSLQVVLTAVGNNQDDLYYTYGDPECRLDTCPTVHIKYERPFYIQASQTIWAYTKDSKTGETSKYSKTYLHKIPHNWTVKITGRYNPQYTAGGNGGIVDGLHGDENWRKGGWQGYQNQDFECVVDLQKETEFDSIHACFLQDQRAWILFPVKVEYAYSLDGKTWVDCKTANNPVDPKDEKVQTRNFTVALPQPVKARYVKIKAINFGKLPAWHQGYGDGGMAFVFVDEVGVE